MSVNFMQCYVKEKYVGPVKILQDHKILGGFGPMGPVAF